jgi:hypothetical protein
MPQYRVTLPDGSQYKINAPEGTSEDAIRAAAQQYAAQERYRSTLSRLEELRRPVAAPPAAPPETTFGGNVKEFFKGLAPGAVGLGETAAAGLAALLPEAQEQAVRGKVGELAQAARAPLAAEAGYEESVGRKLGEALGSTIPFFALRGRTGVGIGTGIGASAGAGEARQAAEAAGATEEQRRLATQLGIGPGLFDILAPNIGPIKGILTTALVRGGVEGATEAAQRVAQNLIAQGVYNPEQEIFVGAGEEGAYGAGAGALASLLIDMTLGRRARQAAQAAQAGAQPPAQPPGAPTVPTVPTSETVTSPVTIPPSFEAPQGELFARDLSLARRQRAAEAEGRPAFELTPQEAPAPDTQMELPFGAPQAAPAPGQRDLIDELESAQIREMVDQDETQQIEQMLLEDARREEATRAQQERLKFESDLAETDARRQEAERKKTEDHRLEILRTIIAEPSVKNIQGTFGDALKVAGYTDTNFTPRERQLIDRANDVRVAQPAGPEIEPSAPAELGAMEAVIPERRETREPQQLGIPGIGKREVRPEPEPAAAPEAALPPGAPGTQMEMFGPRGGVLTPARGARREDLRTQPVGSGTSVAPVQPVAPVGGQQPAVGDTGVPATSQPPGLAPSGGVAQPTDVRTEAAPAPVEIAIAGAPAPAPAPAAPSPAPAPAPAPATRAKKAAPAPKQTTLDKAREGYLLAAKGNTDKALEYLAHDMAFAMFPEKNRAKELNKITLDLAADKIEKPRFSKRDETYAPNTGGKFAEAFFNSLSLEEYKVLTAKMRNIFQDYIVTEQRMNNADIAASVRKQEQLDQNEQTKYGLNLEAPILGMKMHPAIQDRLAEGDLAGALRVMSGLSDGRIAAAAARVADYTPGTKVVLSGDVKNESGKPVAGRFDPATNTIYMNTSMGMSGHTLLHEAVHAVTSHVLANPSHPITKQLTALYKNAVPYLDTAYGARSLDEFVAEAFSNPDFQFKLSGIPAEGNTTVFQRFVRAIQNLVRRMLGMDAQSMESTMDATDRLVMEIMSPAPEFRGAGSLYAASATGNARDPLDIFSKNAMTVPTLTQERVYAVREFFGSSAPAVGKNAIRSIMPLNAIVDVAKDRIPVAEQIGRLVDEKVGAENKRNQMIEPIIKRVSDWATANEFKVDPLNKVIYNSTLYQVDPGKPRSDYVGKVDDSGNKLDAIWDQLQPAWKSLGEDGRGVYRQMRDTYAALHKDVERVLFTRIDDALKDDPAAAKNVKAEIYKRLFESGKLEPYFPLTRAGQYWLSYTADGEFYVEAFETNAMREDAIKSLQGVPGVDGKSIQKFANISQINYRNVPPTSFVNNILQTLEASKKGASAEGKARVDETISEVMNLFLNTLPETSFAQSFRRRKGTLGFNQDAIRALRNKTYNMSRQLTNIEYGAKLEAARKEMMEQVKANGSQEQDVEYMEEFNKRIDFAISPNIPMWSRALTSAGFAMTLGFNVSSAVVQLAQVPIVVLPYLGGKYGYGASTMAIGRANRIFMGSGVTRDVEMLVPVRDDKGNEVEKSVNVIAAPSLDNYDFSDPKNAGIKHLETLARIAGSRGQLNRSMAYETLEANEGDSFFTKVNRAMGLPMHMTERMNRQVSLIAAYELELGRLNKAGEKLDDGRPASSLSAAEKEEYAANQAIYLTELTNGGTAAASAPRISQNALGRIIFMYKRYGASMYYMMYKSFRDAINKENDPEVRKAALKQLAGVQASAALFAGIQGTTMYGIAASIYDMFFSGDDEEKFDALARKQMSSWAYGVGLPPDLFYSGALNALTGSEIASRISLRDLLFREPLVKNENSWIMYQLEQLGGPVLGVAGRVERGIKLINEGYTRRGIEQMLPSAVSSLLKSERFAREGAQTLRGDPVVQEFGGAQIVGQMFGFTPAKYIRELEINSATKDIDRAAGEERTKLLRNYYIARRHGDEAEAAAIMKKMEDFNKRHPGARIDADTVRNSMAQHIKTSKEMVSGVLYSKQMRAELLRNRAEYEGDVDEEE